MHVNLVVRILVGCLCFFPLILVNGFHTYLLLNLRASLRLTLSECGCSVMKRRVKKVLKLGDPLFHPTTIATKTAFWILSGHPFSHSFLLGHESSEVNVVFCYRRWSYLWFSEPRLNSCFLSISHSLFAEYVAIMIVCNIKCEQIVNLQCILLWFEVDVGLGADLSKSSIFWWNIDNMYLLMVDS